ncbi:solute carrier organic anion transporter family member 2B1 isoform X2 [Lepidochelys kempii]|uniref:solute carrier organic anion transporter family member 2B1 isoform X2 n=1 Tax=Lepidochelys kempii TaxID=8472 RepID=UPI003C700628
MAATVTESSSEDQSRRIFCRNPFLNIKFFVFCHGFLQLSQLLLSGYLKSSISTIEKRFGLSSQTSGLLASFNEVGNTLLIVFVSYFGSRVNRPRFIGCGAILVSIAGFLMSLPHFIMGLYEYDQSIASVFSNSTDLCQPAISIRNLSDTDCTPHAVKENREVLLILFIGQALLGIGGVPIQPFGISYIDDFASERNSPLYLGILFALTIIGPGVAFMLGSAILRFYVDIDKVPPEEIQLTNKDPRWVGAWWLGFLVAATLMALSAIPYFFFPKEMPKEVVKGSKSEVKRSKDLLNQLKSKSEIMQSLSLTQFIKIFPLILLRNLRHPVYLLVVLAQVNLSAMVAGLATFMGKFLERQFSLTASFANMIIGSVNIPGAMVGIVAGGAIMKKFQMTLKQCGIMCVIGMLLCVTFAFPLLFLGCPTQKVAGLNYRQSSGVGQHSFECNSKCNCLDKAYNPICGADGIEYISPCFAGCEVVNSDVVENKVLNYTNCRCISANGAEGSASPGTCGTNCFHLLLPFVVLSCLAGILASTSHTPSFMLILRSVQPEDKSFAIGIQFLLLRVFGSLGSSFSLKWELFCASWLCSSFSDDKRGKPRMPQSQRQSQRRRSWQKSQAKT